MNAYGYTPVSYTHLDVYKRQHPASLNLESTDIMCDGSAFVSVISPFVIAAAHRSVPATILSGIIRCSTSLLLQPDLTNMVDVPAPFM